MSKENPSENDLLAEALEQPLVETEPELETEPEQEPETQAAEVETEDDSPTPEADPEDVQPDANGMVPLSVLKRQEEKRKASEDRAAELEKRLSTYDGRFEQMERMLNQQRAQATPQKTPDPEDGPDFWEDPAAAFQTVEQRLQSEVRKIAVNNNLQLYEEVHGEKFRDAAKSIMAQGEEVVAKAMSNPNPGKAIMDWHRNQQLVSETGGDLTAYRQRLRDELLNDPETLKLLGEKLKGGGNAAPATTPGNVRLPPSVSKGTGSGSGKEKDRPFPDSEQVWIDEALTR